MHWLIFLKNTTLPFQHTQTLSSGLSDFNKLIFIVLENTFSKNKQRKIVYANYKDFNSYDFNDELKFVFSNENINSSSKFDKMILDVLNNHAPLKKERLRVNHASYLSKSMREVIIRRSYMENIYFKKRTDKSLRAYKKQNN